LSGKIPLFLTQSIIEESMTKNGIVFDEFPSNF